MDRDVLLEALGAIEDHYILSAQKRFACETQQGEEVLHTKLWSRVLVSIAVAVLLLLGSFVTAMAVDEDFREQVFSFFHLSVTELVPNGNGVDRQETNAHLGNGVSAEYLKLGKECTMLGNGTMYDAEYTENGTVCAVSFYRIVDGTLWTIPTNSTQFRVNMGGTPIHGTAYWSYEQGCISVVGGGGTENRKWSISPIAPQSDVVLVSIFGGLTVASDFHAFLLHLPTGTVAPVFQDTGRCPLMQVQDIQISSDCNFVLLFGKSEGELIASPYLYNRQSGQLISLQEMVAEDTIYHAFFADDRTVLLVSDADNRYTCWSYAVSEGVLKKTIDRMPTEWSETENERIIPLKSQYVLCVDAEGSVVVLNQKDGVRSAIIAGFSYDDRAEMLISTDKTKACYYVSTKQQDSLSIATLGVIDFETAQFTVFDRSGFAVNRECSLSWVDNTKVGISVAGSQFDLYVYEFHGEKGD